MNLYKQAQFAKISTIVEHLQHRGVDNKDIEQVLSIENSQLKGRVISALMSNSKLNINEVIEQLTSDPYTDEEKQLAGQFPEDIQQWVLVKLRKRRMPNKTPEYQDLFSYLQKERSQIVDWYRNVKSDIASFTPKEVKHRVEEWHRAITGGGNGEEYTPDGEKVVYQFDDGWAMKSVFSENNLMAERNKMNHCIHAYYDRVERGETVIISLRDPQNKPHANIELRSDGSINQIKAKNNGTVKPPYSEHVSEFLLNYPHIDSIKNLDGMQLTEESYHALKPKLSQSILTEMGVLYDDEEVISSLDSHQLLITASKVGRLDAVKLAIDKGTDIHANDDEALREAADKGHLDVVQYLVEQGADIHASDDYALRYASIQGHLDIAQYLVEQGADIHADDDLALRWAAYFGNLDIAQYLVEQGADIHADDDDALRNAAWKGHAEVVNFLVEQGANIHARHDDALILAAENGHLDIVKYLVEQGADIHARNDYALRSSSQDGYLGIIKYLVEQGANIHANNDEALRKSVYNGHLEVVKYLVEQGADVHARNDLALKWAASNRHLDVVKYLFSKSKDKDMHSIVSYLINYAPEGSDIMKYLQLK